MSIGIGTGMDIAGQVAGTLLGNALGQKNVRENAELGLRNSKQMTDYNAEKQIEMFERTGYGAQMRQMKEAGLNAGLMYKNGGAGGSTALQSATMTPSGNSVKADLNIGRSMEIQQGMEQTKAQTELIQAQTNLANTQAEKMGGVDTEVGKAEVVNKEMGAENTRLDNLLKEGALSDNIAKAGVEVNKIITETRKIGLENLVSEKTIDEKIKNIELEVVQKTLENELTEGKIQLTSEQTRAIGVELAQEWEKLSLQLDSVNIQQKQNAINEFTAKIQAKLGLDNLQMRRIEAGLNTASKILGGGGKKVDASGTRQTTINQY